MNDDRELRDRIEALQVELRQVKQQVSELRAKTQAERAEHERRLEQSRRQQATLRERAEHAEALARELQARLERVNARLALEEGGTYGGESKLVALARAPDDVEDAILVLSNSVRLSAADARLRLRAPPPIPLIKLPAAEAEAFCAALRDNGLFPVTCDARIRADARRIAIQGFELHPDGLAMTSVNGERVSLPYADIRLLLRGMRAEIRIHREEEKPPPLIWRRVKRQLIDLSEPSEIKEERLEHFLWIFASSGVRVGLSERTSFAGLGEKRAYGIAACLKAFVEEVCARAPHAVSDERLVRMARWKLGLISEDADSHEAMAELLWQAVLTGAWPLE